VRRVGSLPMSIPLLVLVAIALAAVLTVLLMGVWNLARGNNPERSQKLMQWRVALQFLALAIVLIVILVSQH
jgi:ABC-type Na+ efflux pump permease subunit